MFKRIPVVLLTVLLSAFPAAAQFYNDGNEPAGVRWRQITTPDYKVIFPEGLDSLGRIYAARLEKVKTPVGATAGFVPNQLYHNRLPVVLHPWTANANGMVAWTPSRMELFTTPSFSEPLPEPWIDHLTIHESRHVAQMQYGLDDKYRFFNIFLGELFPGAMDVLYCGPAFFEGDAVVAETELTQSGRGRNAAFLEYYRAAFREGDTRDWWKWRYGSFNKFTPDHYTLGYITIAGMRSVYDAPDFTARYYRRLTDTWNPFPLLVLPKTVKEVSGGKKFRAAFKEVTDTLQQRWSRDEAARAPFMHSEQLSAGQRLYADYSGTCGLDSLLYSVRRGLTNAPELVCLKPGDAKARVVRPFAYSTSPLKADPVNHRIWWSEIVSDARWGQVSYSEIWYQDASMKRHRLKPRTRWYNPSVAPDGGKIAVTEYAWNGGYSILVLDTQTGKELDRFVAPDGVQPVETEWVGGRVYASAIAAGGLGIYDAGDGFRRLLDCGHSAVKQLFVHDGTLYFTSDLGGVDELYAFKPGAGQAYRITNTAQGAQSFCFLPDGGLAYSMLTRDGRYIYSTAADELPEPLAADFAVNHRYEFAEDLTAGGPGVIDSELSFPVEQSKPYSRLANAFRFHSWAPVYVDYDAVEDLSFDALTSSAGLGAIAFTQNELSTLQGSIAYNAGYNSDHWVHKGEAKLTYSGFYPVIELGASISSDAPSRYFLHRTFSDFTNIISLTHEQIEGIPSVNASALIYVPMNFSSGGWYRGFVPQVRWNVSNNTVSRGNLAPLNRLSASVRGYVMKATPTSCLYPKLGIGAETGWSGRPGVQNIFNSNAYFYTYGYLPGFFDTHGVRLSGIVQVPVGDALFVERYASVMPRGMGEYSDLASKSGRYPVQSRATLDYAFPFLSIDWSGLGPVAYVRNLECTLHGDYAFFGGSKSLSDMHLGSVGAELCVVLGNLIWIPNDTRIGVKYYYNMGIPDGLNPHFVDMVFSIDM